MADSRRLSRKHLVRIHRSSMQMLEEILNKGTLASKDFCSTDSAENCDDSKYHG